MRDRMKDAQREMDAAAYREWRDAEYGKPAGVWPLIGYVVACVVLGALIAWATL
jgi:hypothetical protein